MLTFFPFSNAAGTHTLQLVVIGKSKNCCFKNCVLPVKYYSQNNAWMSKDIFKEWLHNEFVLQVKEHLKKIGLPQKALLLIDNCPSHPPETDLISEDKMIYTKFLPPNVTVDSPWISMSFMQ